MRWYKLHLHTRTHQYVNDHFVQMCFSYWMSCHTWHALDRWRDTNPALFHQHLTVFQVCWNETDISKDYQYDTLLFSYKFTICHFRFVKTFISMNLSEKKWAYEYFALNVLTVCAFVCDVRLRLIAFVETKRQWQVSLLSMTSSMHEKENSNNVNEHLFAVRFWHIQLVVDVFFFFFDILAMEIHLENAITLAYKCINTKKEEPDYRMTNGKYRKMTSERERKNQIHTPAPSN